jgi:CheY-like chemotaxis protein
VLNLNQVVEEMTKMLRRVVAEDVELEWIPSPDLRNVKVDLGQIEQVIMNLAVNARDAMPDGGKITVKTDNVRLDERDVDSYADINAGDYVLLSVSDTGCGMTEEVKQHLFEPFFTTKEKGIGTGLGLSTVYGIVKQHGGHIWVHSEPNKGTSFKIYFPAVEEPAETLVKHETKTGYPLGSETVLVVEDEASVRDLAVIVLKKCGYEVLQAAGANEALKLAGDSSRHIDIAVMDVIMPGMTGMDLVKILRESHPKLKVIYISGYAADHVRNMGALEDGGILLQKPFAPEQLAQTVRRVLDS